MPKVKSAHHPPPKCTFDYTAFESILRRHGQLTNILTSAVGKASQGGYYYAKSNYTLPLARPLRGILGHLCLFPRHLQPLFIKNTNGGILHARFDYKTLESYIKAAGGLESVCAAAGVASRSYYHCRKHYPLPFCTAIRDILVAVNLYPTAIRKLFIPAERDR